MIQSIDSIYLRLIYTICDIKVALAVEPVYLIPGIIFLITFVCLSRRVRVIFDHVAKDKETVVISGT